VVIESDGYGAAKQWKRKKNQDISITSIPFEQAVVMCVNERLEKSNGN
jgi:hypothetical protein